MDARLIDDQEHKKKIKHKYKVIHELFCDGTLLSNRNFVAFFFFL